VIDKAIILVKLTSRQRPDKLKNCLLRAYELCEDKEHTKWLLSLDTDDPTITIQFIEELQRLIPGISVYLGRSHSKINAINRDMDTYTTFNKWDILVNLSDDQVANLQGWDNIIRDAMPKTFDYSLWFNDNLQNSINTMEIVGFNYWNRTKLIYEPSYKSFYCDEESTHVARILKKQIKDNRCLFKHEHPAGNGNIREDALYKKNQIHWSADQRNFKERLMINFGV